MRDSGEGRGGRRDNEHKEKQGKESPRLRKGTNTSINQVQQALHRIAVRSTARCTQSDICEIKKNRNTAAKLVGKEQRC